MFDVSIKLSSAAHMQIGIILSNIIQFLLPHLFFWPKE